MIFNDELREFVLNGASTLELKREAIRQGNAFTPYGRTTKLKIGLTTIEEVVRATASD
jgi:type IV pilus assembly protein PilB